MRSAACPQAFRGSVEARGDWHGVCMKGERLGNDGSTSARDLRRLWPCPHVLDACKHHIALTDNKDTERSRALETVPLQLLQWRDVRGESDLFSRVISHVLCRAAYEHGF